MGFSFPEKNLAFILYGVTGGDRALAEALWEAIRRQNFDTWQEAWDFIDEFLTEDVG